MGATVGPVEDEKEETNVGASPDQSGSFDMSKPDPKPDIDQQQKRQDTQTVASNIMGKDIKPCKDDLNNFVEQYPADLDLLAPVPAGIEDEDAQNDLGVDGITGPVAPVAERRVHREPRPIDNHENDILKK